MSPERSPLRAGAPLRDAGMSLIELIVVIVVSGLILSVVAGVFINGWTAQQRASERDAATAELNAVLASITETVRGSSATRVSASGQRLDTKTLLPDGVTWECRAWQVSGGHLRYSGGSTARPAVSSAWASRASAVTGTLTGGAAFVKSGDSVSIGLRITQGEIGVGVTNGAVSLTVATGGPACW
jgi:prepilin-type N-terminal cleavage/methylation domain-containing protein